MKKSLLMLGCVSLLASCAMAPMKGGDQYSGTSMDVLQDNQSISARYEGEKLKVQITAGSDKCNGTFEYKSSDKSYLGLTMASENFIGTFEPTSSKSCEKAIGNSGGKKVEVQLARLGGMLGTSVMSTTAIRICEDDQGVCMAQNTFKVSK